MPSRFLSEISSQLCTITSSANKINYLGSRHNFSLQQNSQKPNNIDTTPTKKPGSRIRHSKFGTGIIIRRSGDSLEIAFEKIGLKTIKEDYVELI